MQDAVHSGHALLVPAVAVVVDRSALVAEGLVVEKNFSISDLIAWLVMRYLFTSSMLVLLGAGFVEQRLTGNLSSFEGVSISTDH